MRALRVARLAVLTLVLGGLAGPAPAVANHSSTTLLPDLAMLQPADFRLERKAGKRWLRFSTTIVNVGTGAFDVYGYEPNGAAITNTSTLSVTQRLEDTDASGNPTWSEHPTAARMFFSGDGHNHWHVFGLQEWRLTFQATPNEVLATGTKTGFCFWDNVDLPGFATTRDYDGSRECHLSNDRTRVPMGLTVGWGDRYPWNIAFQYIDIAGLPYGTYCLSLEADPNGEFIESSTLNNIVSTLISIKTNRVTVLAQSCA
jgi:hypothetical protein